MPRTVSPSALTRGNVLDLIDCVSPLCDMQAAVQLIHLGQDESGDGTTVEVTIGIQPGVFLNVVCCMFFMC